MLSRLYNSVTDAKYEKKPRYHNEKKFQKDTTLTSSYNKMIIKKHMYFTHVQYIIGILKMWEINLIDTTSLPWTLQSRNSTTLENHGPLTPLTAEWLPMTWLILHIQELLTWHPNIVTNRTMMKTSSAQRSATQRALPWHSVSWISPA